ncbi:MAG TPA: sugar nucleotide-binding protein [Solirubrobacteraceae bacterium]|nr:sugar nucleotide-binding protein [Solirubrobacteraceae bacterium]
MRVLVTGASGLVGSNVAAAAAQQSWEVLDARAELTDRKACVGLAANWEPDVIVHAAGECSFGRFESDPYAAQREYLGAEHTLAAARHVRARYVLVSSDQVYSGRLPLGWRAGERDLPDPVNAHGRAKLACEEAVMRSAVRWLVVRPGEVYGVNATTPQRLGLTLRLVARLQRRALLPAPAGGVRSPIYARDFSQRLCELIAQGCEGVYNVAGPVALGRLAWAQLLAREFGCRQELVRAGSDDAFMRACGEREGVRLAANAGLNDEKTTAAIGAPAIAPERGLALTRQTLTQTRVPVGCSAR